MRFTEIKPLTDGYKSRDHTPDRLTQILTWITFVLIAAVAAVAADIWLWPNPTAPEAQAAVSTVTLPSQTPIPFPSATPTSSPTLEPTLPPSSPTPLSPSPTPGTPPACVPPNDWSIHLVQENNTLYSLAKRYGTNVDTLMYVNCLNTHTIFIGQRLYVPGPIATPTLPMPLATSTPALILSATPRAAATATPAGQISAQATLAPTATTRSPFKVDIPNNYINIVLLGSDKRPNSGAWRTDSMIVVSVDMEKNVVRLLSIPRDLWVFIPGHGYNRVNTADLWGELAKKGGGPDRVKQTIYYNLGIPIHYYVRVDFKGFMKIVDTVGGIDVDVDCPLSDIDLSSGMHHMNGSQALRYARSRKSTSDFDRGRRQRKVLMALWDQALDFNIIAKIPELWRTMSDSYQTDLPLDQVINLAYVGVRMEPQRIRSKAIGASHVKGWMTPQGAAVLLPREEKIRALLESYYAPLDTSSLDQSNKVHIRVLNGAQRKDAEQLAAAALNWEGFKVASTGQAGRRDYAKTSIFVYNGDMTSAQKIASVLHVPSTAIQDGTVAQDLADPPAPADVDIQIVLGKDYNPCSR